MPANDTQVGGSHYRKLDYQHWDFTHDCRLPWTIASATKYICRWRNKNGIKDLEKAIHYLEKAIELRHIEELENKSIFRIFSKHRLTFSHIPNDEFFPYWDRFMLQMGPADRLPMHSIRRGDFAEAIHKIKSLIETNKPEEAAK